jgi:ATP-dependent RNA helicase DeaD
MVPTKHKALAEARPSSTSAHQTHISPEVENFSELNLSPSIFQGVQDLGYEKPTPIQAKVIPLLLGAPTDFLGLAATGTGKTAAFGIPLLEKIDKSDHSLQALVLCPTRELAIQVAEQITRLGKHKGIHALPVYGGTGFADQIKGLKKGTYVVVATPGRLIDHYKRENLSLDSIRTVILDEADEMISMGFKEDLETVLNNIPADESNIWLFSATMNQEVRKVADNYMRTPQFVQINRTQILSETVEQLYYVTREGNKPDVLCKLIDAAENFYGLVFCQTKALVSQLTETLKSRGYPVECIHGDKDQKAREHILNMFRNRRVTTLICTDVAARGLDIKELSHVINYSLPQELDSYVHRIGRTARSGKGGLALSLVTPSHMGIISRLEKMTRSKMKQGVIPTRKDVAAKKTRDYLQKFLEVPGFDRAEGILCEVWSSSLEKMSKKEIAARFLALSLPNVFKDEEKAEEPAMEKRKLRFIRQDFNRQDSSRRSGKPQFKNKYKKK